MDTAREALEKCPELKLVHVATFSGTSPPAYHPSPAVSTHKVSLDGYRRASREIMNVVRRLCPTMTKASIDEAYLDVSSMVREQILNDFSRGVLEWAGDEEAARADDALFGYSQNDRSELPLPTPAVRWIHLSRKGKEKEPMATDCAGLATEYGMLVGNVSQTTVGWQDLQLKYAAELSNNIRSTIFQELGYRTSTGIAHNKFLAKIGSGFNKPNKQTVFLQSQVVDFMRAFPISSIPMLGGKLGHLVESAFNAQTAGDIMDYTLEQLSIKLGQDPAMLVYSRCRGIDNSPVIDQNEPQSLSTTKNFNRYPVHNLENLDRWILMNSMDLWMRVLEEWETRKRWPRSLTMSYSTIGNTPKSKTVAFPSRHTHGMQDSPDIVVNAVRVCIAAIVAGEKDTGDDGRAHQHAQQTSPLFPLTGFSLTAKSFQREVASASMMQKWLSKSRTGTEDTTGASKPADAQLDSTNQDSGEAIYGGNSTNGQPQEHDRQQEPNIQNTFSLRSSKIQTEAHPAGGIKADAWNGNNAVQNQQTFVQAQAQQSWSSDQIGHAQGYRDTNPNDEYEDYDDYEDEEAESAIYSSSASPSSASTPPPPDHVAHHLYAGSAITAAQYAGHMFGGVSHPMGAMYEADVNTLPPPLDPPRLVQPGAELGSEYDSSDSDMSYLRTPQESGTEEGEEAEEEEEEDYEEEEDDEEEDEEMDDGDHNVQEAPTEAYASISRPEHHTTNNGGNYYAGNSNVAQQSHATEYAQAARSSTSKGKQAARAEEYDYGPSSRATPASSRPRASVYIQSNVDMDSAARYGEGYKHMDIDKHDDGSLVVATSEEARSNSDGFMPALISATRRKREIQIFRFQNPVDAPDNAISGLQANAAAKKSSSSRVSSNRHSRNSSAAGSNVAMGESSLMATVRTRLEEAGAPIAEEEDSTDDEHVNYDDLAPVEGVDLVLDIAVNAMMESMSASQTVMQIRCSQCPGSAPAVSSQEWETHRDWHIARQLQERELRHDQVAQHIQQAFVHVEADRPAVKRARHDGRVAAAPSSSSPSSSPSTSKRRQQTIGEVWK
ncbi:N-acetyltransferase eso1 [Coemansia sp. RSA 2399]|nr:N-acetyltransferase eso1 [Coemansia sp. RSA 2399]KAJ1906513.1 N-acetyltransferase eso1 [Coemansia sp. IMI 209127]